MKDENHDSVLFITNFDRRISVVCCNHIEAKRAWFEHIDVHCRDVDSHSPRNCTVRQLYVRLHSHTDIMMTCQDVAKTYERYDFNTKKWSLTYYTVSQKKTSHCIFHNNLNNKCPILYSSFWHSQQSAYTSSKDGFISHLTCDLCNTKRTNSAVSNILFCVWTTLNNIYYHKSSLTQLLRWRSRRIILCTVDRWMPMRAHESIGASLDCLPD